MLEERRGLLRTWNLCLVVGTFALTTFGTFLTRGSVLLSVHAFADSAVGPLYLCFLALVMIVGFGLVAARAPQSPDGASLEGTISRGSAFVVNNVVLVGLTLIVLLGTIFPLAMEAATGRRVSVGGPYFAHTTVVPLLLLLFLTGAGVLLPWRAGPAGALARRMTVPVAVGSISTLALFAAGGAGVGGPAALAAFGLSAFVVTANGAELVTRVRAAAGASGSRPVRGAVGILTRDTRRVAGPIVHIGIALAAVAITASSSFGHEIEVTLRRGQETAFGQYELTYTDRSELSQPQREVLVANVTVRRSGRPAGSLTPSLNLYGSSNEPIGTPSIHYGMVADLYASVLALSADGSQATFRFYRNPGVTLLWIAGGIVVLGGGLALLRPRRRRQPPQAREVARELEA